VGYFVVPVGIRGVTIGSVGDDAKSTRPINALDGIRAISILLVLVAHFLPVKFLGRSYNDSVGMLGMALFFVLSGYLISLQVGKEQSATNFLARRFARVVPAAWLCIGVVTIFAPMPTWEILKYLFFVSNMPPQTLKDPLDHFWSLCVEVQFYVFVALFMRTGVLTTSRLIATLLISVTILRIWAGVNGTSYTWFRIDDILAGASLGFLMQSHWEERLRHTFSDSRWLLAVAPLLILSSYIPDADSRNVLSYSRPYFSASVVSIIFAADKSALV